MEEIREVALAYYDNCTPELQSKTREFFQSMDTNGDHRISPREFNEFLRQTGYNTIITDPEFFAKLDRNGDRGLDFKEVLTFYYIIKTGYIWCRCCNMYLSGHYFTCVDCFEAANPSTTFDLCDACHGSRRFTHHHTHFLENHVLLYYKRGPDTNMAMGDLYREAIECYYNPSQEFRSLAESFFQSLAIQTHGANQISSTVFNNFLEERRYKWIINDPYLFQKLDRNGDGSLDFWETLTFYHILSTRYFHCRLCKVHLSGLYFTCVACFEAGAYYQHQHHHHHHHHHYDPGTYDLCAACYRSRNYLIYHHPHHTYFLDNHILLRSKRGHLPYDEPHLVTAPKPLVVYNNYYYYNTYNYHLPAVQPVPPKENWLSKLNILEMALASTNLALNCSIM